MAHLHQRNPTTLRNRPISADFDPRPKESSMLYSMLPSVVQSRLPRLPSIRRSVSLYGLPTTPTFTNSSPNSRPGSGARTPEAAYTSAMVLSGAGNIGNEEETISYSTESVSSDDEVSQMETGAGSTRQDCGLELSEIKSGIGWKYANQGLNLLSLAVKESSTISQDDRFGNASFARQLYIHSLTYLLRALPTDLTTEEQLSVRSSLPAGIVEPLGLEAPNFGSSKPQTDSPPSLLHRVLASTIIQLFILFQFIFPYLKYLLQSAYQYDREHKISEKVLSQGIGTVDIIGKRGLALTGTIYAMGEGKVGQLITETAAWFVEGITGGIHEGVGEGMAIMGARRSHGMERR